MQHVRSGWRPAAMALTLGLAGLTNPAQASLFGGDDEARRAILELRQRLEQSQNATRALIEQNTQSQNQSQTQAIDQLRGALLDLQGQIDRLKSELSQSLGAQERLARDLTELQLRQKDVLSSVDDRLRRFEPVSATIDGRDVMVDPSEKSDFEKAMTSKTTRDLRLPAAMRTKVLLLQPDASTMPMPNKPPPKSADSHGNWADA